MLTLISKTFIYTLIITNIFSLKFLPQSDDRFDEITTMLDGFLNGTHFYNEVESFQTCKEYTHELGLSINKAVSMIRNETHNPNKTEAILNVLSEIGDLIKNVAKFVEECNKTPEEIVQLFQKLRKILSNPLYFKNFLENLIRSPWKILYLIAKIDIFYTDKNYSLAGNYLGNLFHLIIFPEIKVNIVNFTLIKDDEYELELCFNRNIEDLKNLVDICKDLANLRQAQFGKLDYEVLKKNITDILTKYNQEYSEIVEKCDSEIKNVSKKI